MATLYFTGDQVAFFDAIDDTGGSTEFTGVTAPFTASDLIEIVIPDQYIRPNGEFDPDEVQFTRVTVVRDGVRYDFDVDSGSKVKETGGSEVKEQGDTFFTTNDDVGPPSSGPFSGLSSGKMVFATDATFTTGESTTIDRTQARDLNEDGDSSDSGESANAGFNARQNESPPCYAAGTLIETPDGPRAVETLGPGDLVMTLDHGPQPIRWCRRKRQTFAGLSMDRRPVLLQAGALGRNSQAGDLVVSPQHRILLGAHEQLAARVPFEAFAPAKALTVLPGVRFMRGQSEIEWLHFACDRHEVVRANGCWSESLLLGRMVWRNLPLRERSMLGMLFQGGASGYLNGPPARPCLRKTEAVRHLMGRGRLILAA